MQEKDILDQIRQECSSVSKNDFSSILESIDNMSPSAGTETVRTGSGRKNIFVKYAAIAAACILPVSLAVWVHRNTAFTGGNGTGGEIDAGVVTEITHETGEEEVQTAPQDMHGSAEAGTGSADQNAAEGVPTVTGYTHPAQTTDSAQSAVTQNSPSVTEKEKPAQTVRPSVTEQVKPEQTVRPSVTEHEGKPEQTVRPPVTEPANNGQTGITPGTRPAENEKPAFTERVEENSPPCDPGAPDYAPTRSPGSDSGNSSSPGMSTQSPMVTPTSSPVYSPPATVKPVNPSGNGQTSGGWPSNSVTFAPPPSNSDEPTAPLPDKPAGPEQAPSTGGDAEFAGPVKAVPGYPYELLYRVKMVTPEYRSDEIFEDASGSWLVENTDSYRICLYRIHPGDRYNPSRAYDESTYAVYAAEEFTIAQILGDKELRITVRDLAEAGIHGVSAD